MIETALKYIKKYLIIATSIMALVITLLKPTSHRKLYKIDFKERFNGYQSGIINKTTFLIQFLEALKN